MTTEEPTKPIYVEPIAELAKEHLQPIRSSVTRRLLAYRCEQGIMLWDRRSEIQHIITWEEMHIVMGDGRMGETA